jgi:hypothetical protein
MLLLLLSRHAGEGIGDPDTLWHILAGDHLRDSWHFVGPDPFSNFTTDPWVLNQWLPELVMSLVHQWFGLAGVAWLAQAGRVGVCVFVYVACRRQAGPLAASVATALAVLGTASNLSPRPQLVGFVLLAVAVSAWLATADDHRPRWWLVPLTWLWASSHGTWVVGVLLGLVLVAGMMLDRRVSLWAASRLALIPVLGVVAAALTPVGPRLFSSFQTVRQVSPYIQEWQRPDLLEASGVAMLALSVIIAGGWLLRRGLASWTHTLMGLYGLVWGLMYVRGVAIAAVILAPLAAYSLDRVLGRPRPARGHESGVVGLFAAASLIVAAVFAAAGPNTPVGVPSRMTPTLQSLPHGSVVFNDDLLGGWLMWSFPDLRHTADTRAELYGREWAIDYLRGMQGGSAGVRLVDELQADAVLIKANSALAGTLRHGGWRVGLQDDGYILLFPTT